MPSHQLIDRIGKTPLIRLNTVSEATGCEILGKAEFMNPGGSVKDRAALGMVLAARESGALKPGAGQYGHRPRDGRQRSGAPHGHRDA